MFLEEIEGLPKYKSVSTCCDECGSHYRALIKTALRQKELFGVHQCRRCSSRRAGKKTAAKMSKIYSEMYSGEGNNAKKPGVGAKISAAKKGVPFSDAHKAALRKKKSKTDKIKEAANSPKERARRSEWMTKNAVSRRPEVREKLSKAITDLIAEGKYWRRFDHGPIVTSKTKGTIICRSGLEKSFVNSLSELDCVVSIESAEYLRLPYVFDGVKKFYCPDFKVTFTDGEVVVVETKGSFLRELAKTKAKEVCLVEYCLSKGYGCITLTEKDIEKWLVLLAKSKQTPELKHGI